MNRNKHKIMRQFYFLFSIVFATTFQSAAQDVIIKCSGEEIKAFVKEVNTDIIKYQKTSGKDKKSFSILKKDVHIIRYSDNSIDFFNNLNVSVKKKGVGSVKKSEPEEVVIVKKKYQEMPDIKQKPSEEEDVLEERQYKNGLFVIYGINYVREVALSASNRVGLQTGIGYRFSKKFGISLLAEPNLYIPNEDNSDLIQTNYMIYPAMIARVSSGLYLYGGVGSNTIVTSTISESVSKSFLTYQTGMIFKYGKLNIKLGYFNIMQYGVRGVMTVGICNNLKW